MSTATPISPCTRAAEAVEHLLGGLCRIDIDRQRQAVALDDIVDHRASEMPRSDRVPKGRRELRRTEMTIQLRRRPIQSAPFKRRL